MFSRAIEDRAAITKVGEQLYPPAIIFQFHSLSPGAEAAAPDFLSTLNTVVFDVLEKRLVALNARLAALINFIF
ncbi:MAG: hypothetical protein BGO06_22325 [Shinella sp. 65-6]|nr:MAG: hypothetical protein BGO06_22325 [Shinella sp. 65-6]